MEVLSFPIGDFLARFSPNERLGNLVRSGVANVRCCQIKLRQWSGLEGTFIEDCNCLVGLNQAFTS